MSNPTTCAACGAQDPSGMTFFDDYGPHFICTGCQNRRYPDVMADVHNRIDAEAAFEANCLNAFPAIHPRSPLAEQFRPAFVAGFIAGRKPRA